MNRRFGHVADRASGEPTESLAQIVAHEHQLLDLAGQVPCQGVAAR